MIDRLTKPAPGRRCPWWVTLADALTCVLTGLAVSAFVTGTGPHLSLAGLRISLTSGLRLSLEAALIASLRHAAYRRPSCWRRLRDLTGRLAQTPLAPDHFPDYGAPDRLGAREFGLVTVVMILLTAIITFPQILSLGAVPDLGDPLFSVWRLKWIAHQLPLDPSHLFDGNMFHPARNTLAFSDSILLPAIAAAPFLWLGVPAVPLYNIWVLLTFVLAGVSMYALVRLLTGRPAAALVAAFVFAFYPFRFEHLTHLELLFSFWMPLVLLGLHRTFAYGRRRDGILTGVAFAAQIFSCLYFGILLCAYVVVTGGAVALACGARRHVKPLLAGAAVTAVLTMPLAWPYLQVAQAYGERSYREMEYYSARPHNYLTAHFRRTTYANVMPGPHEAEKDLFPGVLVVVLATVAVWPPLSANRIAYTLGLLLAFELSLGMHGFLFPVLTSHFLPFRALRVPARASMLVGLSLSVLAGWGTARLLARLRRPTLRHLFAAALCAIVLFESRATVGLQAVPPPHPIYRWFDGRPASVIAELPAPRPVAEDEWKDVRYLYPATFHWQRLVNGNSGLLPPSHTTFCAMMQTFPDDRSIALLRQLGVDFVIVHEEYYAPGQYAQVIAAIRERADVRGVKQANDGRTDARIYALTR